MKIDYEEAKKYFPILGCPEVVAMIECLGVGVETFLDNEQLEFLKGLDKKSEAVDNVDTSHYESEWTLTEEEIKSGKIKIDPYLVAHVWKLGEKDSSGCLFHILKTIARFGVKKGNTIGREIASMKSSIERLKQLYGRK